MKLVDFTNSAREIVLPPDLLWEDEFSYTPVATDKSWGVGGALILQRGTRLQGRPITLKSPDQYSGWIYRTELQGLYDWAADATRQMVLHLELDADVRTFTVAFDASSPVEAQPVKGWKQHDLVEPYTLKLKLIQVA